MRRPGSEDPQRRQQKFGQNEVRTHAKGGPSGGSSVCRPGSECPNWREPKLSVTKLKADIHKI